MNNLFGKYFHRILLTLAIGLFVPSVLLGQVIINELMASNNRVYLDPEAGIFSDWIELLNTGNGAVDLSGYWLSDKPNKAMKWIFPEGSIIEPQGYMLIMADKGYQGLHTSFALSRDGESVVFGDPSGGVLDRVDFEGQKADVSYGRDPVDHALWRYFAQATPGSDNATNGLVRPVTAKSPDFSIPAGFYYGGVVVEIGRPEGIESGQIRYTLDGSDPTPDSPVYESPITVSKTTVIKARMYVEYQLPSPIVSHTYLLDEDMRLPLFSIALDEKYLYDGKTGIYVDGDNFHGPRDSRNSCQEDWERPISIEYFDADGRPGFNELAGIQVKGRMNCEFPKKPLGVFFRSRYGNGEITQRFFKEKTVTKFSSFYLRPGGADGIGNKYNGTMFRDGLLNTLLIGKMDIDYEAYQPAILFVNGEYWGIHNIRERNKSDFLAGNYGVDPDAVDILENESNGGVIEGSRDHYDALLDLVRFDDLNDPQVFEEVRSMMDIDEFINYQIAEIFVNNEDWANNNVLCWRPQTPDGKWRWVFFDVEGGFGLYHSDDYLNNMFGFSEDNALHHRTLFYALMTSTWFHDEFIQRFATYLNTTFNTDRVLEMIDQLKAVIEPDMPRDINRWKGLVTQGGAECRAIESLQEWEAHVEIMREFARHRPGVIVDQLKRKYNLNDPVQLTIQSDGGEVWVNGTNGDDGGSYFPGVPMRLEARPAVGYRFAGWIGVNGEAETAATFVSDTSITAVFESTHESIVQGNINETVNLTKEGSPYLALGDIIVEEEGVLKVEAGVEIRMPAKASIYVYGAIQVDGEETDPVIITHLGKSGLRWGSLVIDYGAGYSYLDYLTIENASVGYMDPVLYKANLNIIGTYAPVAGLSIPDALGNPVFFDETRVWIRDSYLHSTGICDLINVAHSADVVIEGCELMGDLATDTDAVDLDAVSNAEIRNNHIFALNGFNSDGLDIGYSTQIHVYGNHFEYISDKGISVGNGSQISITQNLFTSCEAGIGVKDQGSTVQVDRNTFYGNNIGVHCFEKEPGRGGGIAEVVNTIFAGPYQIPFESDAYSSVDINYSLSENQILPGEENLSGPAGFISENLKIFRLASGSQSIDRGDPNTAPDPDGTLPDLGCFYHHHDLIDGLFINEIQMEEGDQWIELYNASTIPIDLSQTYFFNNRDLANAISFDQLNDTPIILNPGGFIQLVDDNHLLGLSPNGGYIAVGQYLTGSFQLINELEYPMEAPGYSYGCYPDGSYTYRHFEHPSDGGPNYVEVQRLEGIYINEFLAMNQTGISDDLGFREDWIELFNSTDEPVDVGGLYLTDNLNHLAMSKIPDKFPQTTTIPSKGFLVFWADGNSSQGPLHLNFKLDGDGEALGLAQVIELDTLLLDGLQYGTQKGDISFGRIPDGGPEWKFFSQRTPGAPNIYLGVEIESLQAGLLVYPNPAKHMIQVRFKTQLDTKAHLELIYADGRSVYQTDLLPGESGPCQIEVDDFTPGVYLVSVLTVDHIYRTRVVIQ